MFDEKKARRVIRFIEYLKHTKGEFHGKPFRLLPWQEKIIRDVFGTVRDEDPSMRQYNQVYIEIGKKNGKSELGAALALNMLINDDEWKAEVYSCASDRQQAAIVFDVAVDMVKQNPTLSKLIKIIPSTKRMVYQPTGSIYQVLSSEVATKHGLNVSACIFDELHTQPTRALYDVMTQGSGDARKQPLWFFLTTAGTDRNSVCWEVHQKALDILEGRKWTRLSEDCILRAPVPAAMTPSVELVTQQYQTSTYDVQIYKITTKSGPLHLRSGTGTNYKILGKYKNGREVIVLNKTTSSWYEVTAPDGKHGYMASQYLTFQRTETQTIQTNVGFRNQVIEARPLRDQPFRIYRVVPELDKVTSMPATFSTTCSTT